MPIAGQGRELQVKRLGMQKKGGLTRTYGTYQVYINGNPTMAFQPFVRDCWPG